MRDDQEDAGELVDQKVLEDSNRVEVEVVGGLVEAEEIGLPSEHLQQLQPPPLPATQLGDTLIPPEGQEEEGYGSD